MSKANRSIINKREKAIHEGYVTRDVLAERAKQMLLAGLARKFGTVKDDGSRELRLSEQDMLAVPKGEELSIKHVKTEGGGGVSISVRIKPEPAPEVPVSEPVDSGVSSGEASA